MCFNKGDSMGMNALEERLQSVKIFERINSFEY